MIIWLNGAFGAGKTQTAYELQRRLKSIYVYDPENAGYFIRKNIPTGLSKNDFQDYPMWRTFNLSMLSYIAEHHAGDIIVPMTITNRRYYDELLGELSRTWEVRHFILYAERAVLLRRLASRFEGRNSWGAQQIDRCLRAFDTEITEQKIHTDSLSIREAAEQVATLAGLTLPPDQRSGLRRSLDTIATQLRHIR